MVGECVMVQQTTSWCFDLVLSAALAAFVGDVKAILKALVAGYGEQPKSLHVKPTAEQTQSGMPPDIVGGKVNLLDFAVGETWRWWEEAVVRVCFIAEWPRLTHLALKLGVLDTCGRIVVVVTFLARGKSGSL